MKLPDQNDTRGCFNVVLGIVKTAATCGTFRYDGWILKSSKDSGERSQDTSD